MNRLLFLLALVLFLLVAFSCSKQDKTSKKQAQSAKIETQLSEVKEQKPSLGENKESEQQKRKQQVEIEAQPSAVLVKSRDAQNSKTEPASEGQVKMIDTFDQKTDEIEYFPYHGETVINQEGYGIYYERADAQLSRVTLREMDKALRIQYELPPFYYQENWISIRKEFEAPLDLSEFTGLELDIKVEIPSDALLRITLADVEKIDYGGKQSNDELWWFDFSPAVLKDATKKWVTLRAPFKDFFLSYGVGTRYNDGKKDFSKIIAYEINLISERGKHPKGVILVNSLCAYKNRK